MIGGVGNKDRLLHFPPHFNLYLKEFLRFFVAPRWFTFPGTSDGIILIDEASQSNTCHRKAHLRGNSSLPQEKLERNAIYLATSGSTVETLFSLSLCINYHVNLTVVAHTTARLQFEFVISNVHDELSIFKLKPHKACPETAKVQMLHLREEEEGIVLDLDVEKMRYEDETGSFSQQEVLPVLHQSRPRSGGFCSAHTGDESNLLAARV